MNADQQGNYRPVAEGMLALTLYALAWVAPPGLLHWGAISGRARIYYAVLLAAGAVLVACGVWALRARRLSQRLAWIAAGAAVLLGINQAAGSALGIILCLTPV